jgi:uncharacterized membrane protein
MQQKYLYINKEETLRRIMNIKLKNTLHLQSGQVNVTHKNSKEKIAWESGPGQYNLNSYDIEFRMRKRIDHKNKLRLMDISIPAFNSKVPRSVE